MIKKIGILLALILSSGCTTTSYEWHHPTKAENDFYADKQTCEARALQMYPQILTSEIIYGKTRIIEQPCITKDNKAAQCKVAVTDPPLVTSVDSNKNNRRRIIDTCIKALGWTEHTVTKPATLF